MIKQQQVSWGSLIYDNSSYLLSFLLGAESLPFLENMGQFYNIIFSGLVSDMHGVT